MSGWLPYLARRAAYLIALLLSAVWTFGALESLTYPLFDLARPHVGDVILSVAKLFSLAPERIPLFALTLVGLKLMVGALLLTAVFSAVYEKIYLGYSDDAVLDVALFVAALATVAAAIPGLMYGGEPLQAVIGELMLCVIASVLAIYGRGYIAREELPQPVRPVAGYLG